MIHAKKQLKNLFFTALVSGVVFSFCCSPVFGQISGAIFTTDVVCDGVDLNIYKFKQDVYLDGGPRKEGSAGLPPGEYYVQVTSPNGIVLGTSLGMPDETPVEVNLNGAFVTCYQLCEILMIPNVVVKGNGNSCGYADTPNNGGEYKVWISLSPDFVNSVSKTDNFKVRKKPLPEQTEIRAVKFYDADADGEYDIDELPIADWHIELRLMSDDSLVACQLTDGGGEVTFLVEKDGTEYVVVELPPDLGWYPVGNYSPTTPESVLVAASEAAAAVEFGNVCIIENVADFSTKGYWHNKNGISELGNTPDEDDFFDGVIAWVNELDPYDSPTGYFSKGAEPFDGKFTNGDPVPAGKGVLENEDIADAGTIEAEISNFLIDSVGDGGIREQLAQQLLAFIFNAFYRVGDLNSMIIVGGEPETTGSVIDRAVAAWASGTAIEQNVIKTLLDEFNNNDEVTYLVIPAEACAFDPLPCP